MSDDHRSSNEDEGKDGESKRKSSSLTTNQNQKIKPGLTSGGFSIYGIDRYVDLIIVSNESYDCKFVIMVTHEYLKFASITGISSLT